MINIVNWPECKVQCEVIPYYSDLTELKSRAAEMIDFVKAQKGLGLAGPQIGYNKRMFVTVLNNLPRVYVDPVWTAGGEEKLHNSIEACYSVPGKYFKVKRHRRVGLEWFDPEWNLQRAGFNGLEATVVQHEMDHLYGLCIADKGKLVATKKGENS